ncbi:c-type cytochrome [Acetobacter orientalis]|uniref:c-type cytochrome n=1 Tax=Acetobacter orientalis TaxID=146474 RepID=UPI0011779AD3|nr:cytochrome c [Acetobacter orientalis]
MTRFLQKTVQLLANILPDPAQQAHHNHPYGTNLQGSMFMPAAGTLAAHALLRGMPHPRMNSAVAVAIAPLALVIALSAPAHAAGQNGKTKPLPTATYTAEQAERGAETYKETCALCHGPALAGAFDTPPLTGRFVANWSGVPLRHLFDYIRHAMPLSAPGALSDEENADILAFLLRENGVAASKTPLPSKADALERVAFPHIDPTKNTAPVPQ